MSAALPVVVRLALSFGAVLVAAGCGRGGDGDEAVGGDRAGRSGSIAPTPPEQTGHERMRATLARIAEEVLATNRFLGEAELPELRERLARLQPDGDAGQRIDLGLRIAVHELRLGRNEEALASLEQAEALEGRLPEAQRPRAEALRLYAQGMAWLRVAEAANCIRARNCDSCIFPITGGGLHEDPTGSREAMRCFLAVVRHPATLPAMGLRARWLLNVAAMTLGEHPEGVPEEWRIAPEAFAADEEFPRFAEVAEDVGLATLNLSGGVVIEDLDGDGLLDVLVSAWDYTAPLRLFRNRGDGRFDESTAEAGLDGLVAGLNLTHADYDNDGDADVLVLRGAWFDELGRHPNSLLRNDGSAQFIDVTFEAGLAEPAYPTQVGAWADYDGDGNLDLFVGNESSERTRHPCQLFRNDGRGAFADVAAQAGVENLRFTKGAAWGDFDDDGDPDLYVSNFQSPNRLYRNLGDGRFTDMAVELGVELPLRSFSSWVWDYDNDGHLDIYCAAYVEDVTQNVASRLGLPHADPSGRLYRNDGRGGFEDRSEQVGLDLLATTMGAGFGDLDNDGWLDFYLGTGYPSYEGLVPNVMYRNRGGQSFADVTSAGGFGHLQKGHAVAFADLDNDGDQDVFEQMGGAFLADVAFNALYENPGNDNHWLRLELQGRQANRSAIGARVTVQIEEGSPPRARTIHRQVGAAGSFGSAPLHLHIGLGSAEVIGKLTVLWPGSGTEQVFEQIAVDRFLRLVEGAAELVELPRRVVQLGGP